MKKYINLLIIWTLVFSLLGSFKIVQAVENSDMPDQNLEQEGKEVKDTSKEEIKSEKEDAKSNMEALREVAKQKMEELKNKVKEEKNKTKAKIKEERITGREKALERFDKAVEKMSELKNKVSVQIIKLELKSINTADAKSFIATAETKLNEAKIKIIEVNTLLAGSINQLSTEEKVKLLTLTTDIQSLIKETHQALNDAVKSLKDAVKVKLESLKTEENNPAPKD